MKKRPVLTIVGAVVLILSVPAIVMQFTREVNWGPEDFVVAGILLFSVGLLAERIIRKVDKTRMLWLLLLLLLLVLVWLELAVGLFGSPFSGR
jgi:hypothetical protein